MNDYPKTNNPSPTSNEADAMALALFNEAQDRFAQGELDDAMDLLVRAAAICRASDNGVALLACLNKQVLVLDILGDYDGMLELLGEVESLCQRLSNAENLLVCLGYHARAFAVRGDLAEAETVVTQAENICRQLWSGDGQTVWPPNEAEPAQLAATPRSGANRLQNRRDSLSRRLKTVFQFVNLRMKEPPCRKSQFWTN